jgi:hypothetical protein
MSGFVSGHSFSFTFNTTSAAGIPTAVPIAPTLKIWIDGVDTSCVYDDAYLWFGIPGYDTYTHLLSW